METRIYVVVEDGVTRLVKAISRAQAISHCVKERYTARAARVADLETALAAGIAVEQAAADPEAA